MIRNKGKTIVEKNVILESIIYIYICIILINVIYNIFFNLKLYGIRKFRK